MVPVVVVIVAIATVRARGATAWQAARAGTCGMAGMNTGRWCGASRRRDDCFGNHRARDIAFGILDPTKVARSALQNAAPTAGLMITTEAMVAELPKKEEPHAHGGGGMGGMDF